MAVSSFVLILWVHLILVGSVEISGVGNLKLLLSRNKRDNPPAENSTVTLNDALADLNKKMEALKAQKEALLNNNMVSSSASDVSTTEIPVPAKESAAPKDVGSKTDVNIDKLTAKLENLDSLMHKIDDKLKEEEKEISKVQKEEEKVLKYLQPDTSPPATAKVEPSGTTSTDQVGKETTLSSETTPRSEAAPSNDTITGKTGVNGTSKNATSTGKSEGNETVNEETGDKKTATTPKPLEAILPSSGKNSGGVLIYVIMVLVLIIVGYAVYVNKAKIKACYLRGEKKGEDKSGTKSRSGINYEKLKKDDDDMTLFEKKALKSNYIY